MRDNAPHVGRRVLGWLAVFWTIACFGPLLIALRDPSFRSDPESILVGVIVLGLVWLAGIWVVLFLRLFVE